MQKLENLLGNYIDSTSLSIEWLEREVRKDLGAKSLEKLNELEGRLAKIHRDLTNLGNDVQGFRRMCVTLGINPDKLMVLENGENGENDNGQRTNGKTN